MKANRTSKIAGFALAISLCAIPSIARDHSDLTGTWALIPADSEFGGQPVIQTGSVTIRDREGTTVIERSFKYDGANDTYFYKDSIGDEHGGTVHVAKDLKTKTKWDRDVLRVITTDAGQVTTESYMLGADGKMKATVERPGHPIITLTFVRK